MAQEMAYNSLDGSLWVFPEGPNHQGQYLGCADSEDITEPQGDVTLTYCFNGKGKWEVVGKKKAPPGAITTTLTTLTYRKRNFLEKIKCEYGLMILQNDGGRSDLFCNHQRATILDAVYNTSKAYTNLLKRETNDDSMHGFTIAANPPVIEVAEVEGNRKPTAETEDFTDVFMLKGLCDPCLEGVAVALDSGMYAAGDVWLTHDGGQIWTVTTGTPLVHDLQACTMVDMCNDARRIIVAGKADAGAAGQIAYSDDDGVTWTIVYLDTPPTNGTGATHGGAIFAIDSRHIWLAGAGGHIYFSEDGGETWAVQENAVITSDDYSHIEMTPDGLHGYAVAEAGAVAKTLNGGYPWTAATIVTGTPDLLTVAVMDDDYAWVGDATGGLWWTEDGGDTWTQRTGWIGSGTAVINDVAFANDWVGFMIADIAGVGKIYRTIDGGYTWDMLDSDVNLGLLSLSACDPNYAVYVGKTAADNLGFVGVVEE